LNPHFDIKDDRIRNLVILTLPIILANTVEQIGIMIDKNLASQFGPGALSSLAYATRTSTAISGIFITSILVVSFPKIAKQAADGDMTKMKNSLAESIVGMSLFLIPVIAAIVMFTQPIVSLLFGRGAFNSSAISTTSSLLFFYIFFLFGNGLTQLISRVFYALGDSKTPMIVAAGTVVINMILNFILIVFMGITGLSLATSISAFIGMLVLLFLLRHKIGSLRLRDTLISLNKITGASIAMVFGAYFIYQYLTPYNEIVALFVAAVVGIGIYGLLLLVLRIREIERLIVFILRKIEQFIKNRKDL
jgi:putative peptidoglycan lipid II flippase